MGVLIISITILVITIVGIAYFTIQDKKEEKRLRKA
jgi:protein-S-isoprenylcysteine O-methyltransferase Ste14